MKILINNMSNYFKAALLLGAITMVGCEKRLDIAPTQSIADNLALNTEGDVLVTLVGAYDGAQSAAAYGGDIMVLNDLIGNSTNINFTGTFAGLSDAYQTQMVSDNGFARDTWAACYNTINRCNNVLTAVAKVTSSTAKRNSVEGEALMLRASMYFELVRLYAKFVGDGDYATNPGVPLVLTPTGNVTDANYPARATVKAVYDQVIADLTKAESLLPNSNGNYVSKWAAAAQLSRVHLMVKDYAAARDAANRVIAGSGKNLAANFGSNWFTFINNAGATPGEYLFSLKVTAQDGTNSQNTYFGRAIGTIPGTAGRSDCKIRATHINAYEAGDFRKGYFILSGGNNYTLKHLDRFGDVAIIRLAEMFLTRAECNQRLNTTVGATPVADINRIRNRVGLPSLVTVSLADITKERSFELAFEGHNLIEAKRLQTPVGTLAWNDPKLILPIPRRETDVNKNLVQNAGY
ncbi:RagB/SusD family nutrient uptake outer membrane protein [Sediminibacterium sp.]|uniref:RagB/SusD family nutrient uptake outer membrane protein n=1 Tax=Sediminibacterium sp. TaxID=1917865 RepID=UPI003F6FAF92